MSIETKMDTCEQYYQKQHQTVATHLDKYHHHFLVKILQFLVPLSLLSFFLSYSLGFFHCFNFHFSTLLFPLFTHTLERKYMFLICNAILAFLAKDSCFTASSPAEDDHFNAYKYNAKNIINEVDVKPVSSKVAMGCSSSSSSIQSPHNVEVQEAEEEQVNASLNNKEAEERQNCALVMGSDYDEGEESEESGSLIPASSSPEDKGNEVNLSIEELNRKFDDFIRKMKEEIRIEAQRQLITV